MTEQERGALLEARIQLRRQRRMLEAVSDARPALRLLEQSARTLPDVEAAIRRLTEALQDEHEELTPVEPLMARKPTPPPGTFSGLRARSDTSPGMEAFSEPPEDEEK